MSLNPQLWYDDDVWEDQSYHHLKNELLHSLVNWFCITDRNWDKTRNRACIQSLFSVSPCTFFTTFIHWKLYKMLHGSPLLLWRCHSNEIYVKVCEYEKRFILTDWTRHPPRLQPEGQWSHNQIHLAPGSSTRCFLYLHSSRLDRNIQI